MNQCSWTYVDDAGKPHRIGLAHGATSGHLLIHINARVALIDFNVLDTASYSLFINEELFNIGIEKKGEDFRYAFEIDRKADTPRNRKLKEQEKKHWLQTLAVVGGVLLAVVLFTLVIRWNSQPNTSERRAVLVSNQSGETVGQVVGEEDDLRYVFVARGQSYKEPVNPERLEKEALLPVEVGDKFIVRFDPNNPSVNAIDYRQPTAQQLEEYRNKVAARHKALHPEVSDAYIACQLKIAEQLRGIEGLALFYFQDVSPAKNAAYNVNEYKKFVRDLPFQKALKERCW